MEKTATNDTKTPNYQVKNIEPVITGSDVRARLFTLAPGEVIPWHHHREAADYYFILEGELMISARTPEEAQTLGVGRNYQIAPGRPHLVANRSTADCRFLLLQGVGKFDWVKEDDRAVRDCGGN